MQFLAYRLQKIKQIDNQINKKKEKSGVEGSERSTPISFCKSC